MTGRKLTALCALVAVLVVAAVDRAAAEAAELRISRGYGIHYLPLYIMERFKLVEKHAAAAGLPNVKVTYVALDGGNVINDAMLAGALDIASLGVPGFLTLWDKARSVPQYEVKGWSASVPARCGLSPAIRT
jgi:NitT/TauT family transport system substrate-binding protein